MNFKVLLTDLKDRSFYKNMLAIALPVMLQSFISSLINMVDTVMVGKLGEVEIAAVGIANQYFFFFIMFLVGLCGGVSVFIAQYWGKKDVESIRKVLGLGIASIFLITTLFLVVGYGNPAWVISLFSNDPIVLESGSSYLLVIMVSYLFTGITFLYSFSLRSIGQAKTPLKVNVFALVCNVVLNYILIFGKFGAPALGVVGAALATLIARVLETLVLLLVVYAKEGPLKARFHELFHFDFAFVRRSFQTIMPVILNDIFWGLASLVYIAVYGRMGTQAVAVIQIANTVNNLFMVVAFGLSSSAAVLIGNSIGAGNEDLVHAFSRKFMITAVVVSLVMGGILALLSPLILNFFEISPGVRSSAQSILYMISAVFLVRVLGIMLVVGILRGGGDAAWALIIESFTMWCVGVPMILLGAFVFKLPVHYVYALALTEEIAKVLLSVHRLRSGKWIRNLTH